MSEIHDMTLPVGAPARENDEVRKVLWTGDNTQLVLMALRESGEIAGARHEAHDPVLYFGPGSGVAKTGDVATDVTDGDVGIVPSGACQDFRNTGTGMRKPFTTYSPSENDPGTEPATRSETETDR